MCLERSESLPLTVSLSNFSQWSSLTYRLIGSHVSRFERLHLNGPLSSGLSDIFSFLTPGEEPLLLRDLALVGTQVLDRGSTHEDLRSPILSKDVPTLHKLRLSSFPLIPQLSVLRHLTELDLNDPGPTSTNTLLDLLANNPGLQRVGITGPLDNQESPRGDQSIALPHLRCFEVRRCDAVDILRCLHLPRLEPLEIHMQSSFQEVQLPGVYQPLSVIHFARDFGFHQIHLYTCPKFNLTIHNHPAGGAYAELEELPPNTTEVLGPLTVQFIKYLHFWENEERPPWESLGHIEPFLHMLRLETLVLDCLAASLVEILIILNFDQIMCPLFRTLIIQFPERLPALAWKDFLFEAMRKRANRGNPIWRLRVVVQSEEEASLYSGIFRPFVQEIEILVRQPEQEDRSRWLVWEK